MTARKNRQVLPTSLSPTRPDNLASLQIMAASGPRQTVGARTASEHRAPRCRIAEKLFSKEPACSCRTKLGHVLGDHNVSLVHVKQKQKQKQKQKTK